MRNLHSPSKDIRSRDLDSNVFELHDKWFYFFKVCFWLQEWKSLVVQVELKNFRPHTSTSLIHTSQVIPKIVNYLSNDECDLRTS